MKKIMNEYMLFNDSLFIKLPREFQCKLLDGQHGMVACDVSTGSIITVTSSAVKEKVEDKMMIEDILSVLSRDTDDFELVGVYKRNIDKEVMYVVVMTFKGAKGQMYAMNGYLIRNSELNVISMVTAGYYAHKMKDSFAQILESVA